MSDLVVPAGPGDFRISDAAIRYEDDSTNMRFGDAFRCACRSNVVDRTDLDSVVDSREARCRRRHSLPSDAEAGTGRRDDAGPENKLTFSHNTAANGTLSRSASTAGSRCVTMRWASRPAAGCDKVQFWRCNVADSAFYTRVNSKTVGV